jgi:hypothetical protein
MTLQPEAVAEDKGAFLQELVQKPNGDSVLKCIQCGARAGTCPLEGNAV